MHAKHRCISNLGMRSNAVLLYLHSSQVHAVPTVYSWAATSSQHEGKIQICPFLCIFSSVSTFVLLLQHQFTAQRIPDEGLGHRLPWGSVHALPSFPSPTLPFLPTTVKLTLCHPASDLPTPCWFNQPQKILHYHQSQYSRWDVHYRPKTLIHCCLTVIPNPGPSPSSCVIGQLKYTVLES